MSRKRQALLLDSEWAPNKQYNGLYSVRAIHVDLSEWGGLAYTDMTHHITGNLSVELAEHIVEAHNMWREGLADLEDRDA